jgi:hypothetical protein
MRSALHNLPQGELRMGKGIHSAFRAQRGKALKRVETRCGAWLAHGLCGGKS